MVHPDLGATPIPVTVVAGFLGAGKTTLLNHILTSEHGRRIGVLVNDFGSLNVDAELITEVEGGMIDLANGCICCSIRMDLIRAVMEMAARPDRPEHIVIESSGVADPGGVVKSFLEPGIWDTVQLDGVITVIDAEQAIEFPDEEARLARIQVAGGDPIVLNSASRVSYMRFARDITDYSLIDRKIVKTILRSIVFGSIISGPGTREHAASGSCAASHASPLLPPTAVSPNPSPRKRPLYAAQCRDMPPTWT